MAEQVVGGKTDDQHVRDRMAAQLLAGDKRAREIELVGIGRRSGSHRFIEFPGTWVAGFLLRLRGTVPRIKGGHPVWKRVHVIAGSDEGAGSRFDPVGAVGRIAGGQNGGAIFERDAEDFGLALGRQAQRVANGGGAKIERGGSGLLAGMDRAQDAVAIVLDRGYGTSLVAAQVPPRIGGDAVAVGIGPGSQGGVAGSGLGVGVVVVAIFEVSALVEEEAEAAAFEIGTVAVEVVGAKLVDHQDDDQPGMCIVGAGPSQWRPWNNQ